MPVTPIYKNHNNATVQPDIQIFKSDTHYYLIFNNLRKSGHDKAQSFLSAQIEDGGAGYWDVHFNNLSESYKYMTSFNFKPQGCSYQELKDCIAKVTTNVAVKNELISALNAPIIAMEQRSNSQAPEFKY